MSCGSLQQIDKQGHIFHSINKYCIYTVYDKDNTIIDTGIWIDYDDIYKTTKMHDRIMNKIKDLEIKINIYE